MTARRLSLLIGLSALGALGACRHQEAGGEAPKPESAPPPAVRVQTTPVEVRKMPRYLTLTGSIVADRSSEMAANVAGRILSAPVERGQAVKTGQVIATVDARGAAFSASAASAQQAAAESQVQLAQADCERAEALWAKGAISKADYERLKTQCSAQVYNATALRANADLAKKQLGDTTIRAPFDGVIGERYVNVGEYVSPQTRVASIVRITPVRISVSVPEAAVPLVKQGDTLNVRVAAYGDRDFPATVRYVAPALRAQTRDLLVEAVAPNTDGALRPGMFATVRLLVGEEEQPTVPVDAVRVEGTTKRMFLARGGQAWEMVIRTGAEKEGRVAVLEAIASDEKVVIKPPPGLRDGQAILQ